MTYWYYSYAKRSFSFQNLGNTNEISWGIMTSTTDEFNFLHYYTKYPIDTYTIISVSEISKVQFDSLMELLFKQSSKTK